MLVPLYTETNGQRVPSGETEVSDPRYDDESNAWEITSMLTGLAPGCRLLVYLGEDDTDRRLEVPMRISTVVPPYAFIKSDNAASAQVNVQRAHPVSAVLIQPAATA